MTVPPTNRAATSPSEVLREEFGIAFDGDVTPLAAAELAVRTGTSPELWLNLQANHDATKGVAA